MDRWKLWGNAINFGVENSFSVHINGKNKTILVLGEELTKGLSNATITAEAKQLVSFTESGKWFLPSLHYDDGNNS